MHADVAEDLLCGRCGYDLRGLDESQRCPECGAAILPAESRRLLVHASPLWLRTLTRGLWWLELSFGLLLALAVLLVLGISEGIVRAFEGLPLAAILLTLGAATIAASALSGCIGLLLATTPEPAERLHPRRGAWRRRTRGATVALMLGVAGAIASYSLPAWSRAVWTGAALMLSLLFVVLGVCFSRWMVELHARSQLSTVSGARMAVALTAVVASCGAAYGAAVLVALNRATTRR